jgi:hypothetical protein
MWLPRFGELIRKSHKYKLREVYRTSTCVSPNLPFWEQYENGELEKWGKSSPEKDMKWVQLCLGRLKR